MLGTTARVLWMCVALLLLSACGASQQVNAYVGCYTVSTSEPAFLQLKEQDGKLISGNYYSDRGWEFEDWTMEPVQGSAILQLVSGLPPQLQGVLDELVKQFPGGYANMDQHFGIFRASQNSYSVNSVSFDTPYLLASVGVVPVYKVDCQ